MKVWIVTKSYPSLDLVDENLNVVGHDVCEVVAVCGTQESAESVRVEFQRQADYNVREFDCDPVSYDVAAWEVE